MSIDSFLNEILRMLEHIFTLFIVVLLTIFLPIKIIFGDKVNVLKILSQMMKSIFVPVKVIFLHVLSPFFIFIGKSFFGVFVSLFNFVFNWNNSDLQKGAKFLNSKETKKIVNKSQKGLLIDGNNGRISDILSFSHSLVVSNAGAGKTSQYIIPNILTFASDNEPVSMVITDPSGEIFEKTSGYLKKQGFTIQVLNPSKPQESLGYNPLAKVETVTDIEEIAHILVESANPDTKDSFWKEGAKIIIQVFIHCLKSLNKPEFLNLHNVLYLLQNFSDRKAIDLFVAINANKTVCGQYKGFIGGNANTFASFLSTATTSLKMFSNTDICKMMSKDEIRFEDMRTVKTALFLIVPSEKVSYYSFFLNIFYTQLFQACMKNLPKEGDLPIYVLMDEFANIGTISNFSSILATIRKYKVSLSLILQDLSQLSSNYGHENMEAILGNTASKLCYGGVSITTAQYFEKMIGKADNDNKKDKFSQHLIEASQIRTLPKGKGLFIVSDKNPILLKKIVPYFQNRKFIEKTKLPVYVFNRDNFVSDIQYLSLEEVNYDSSSDTIE
ncbi:MAG: type IV secretory system conjugative DNA transfer family protein [Cyanobacteriota bacterium]